MISTGLPQLNGLAWRPLTPSDAEAMSQLATDCNAVDRTHLITPVEMAEEFARFGDHAATDSVGAFAGDGRLLAFAWAIVLPTARTERRAILWKMAHPDVRAAVDDPLVDWMEAAGTARLRTYDDDVPRGLYVYEIYDWLLAEQELYERHGYERARYFTENLRDLSAPIDDVPLPDGLTARPWSDAASQDARDVHNAAFRDHWGSQPLNEEHWASFRSGEFFLPDRSWVVYDGDEPVAYVACSQYPHDWEDRGRTEGWIDGIGTIRSHRKRGIASALIAKAMRAFREDGLEYACLGVDAASPTGANAIYERHGFVPEKRSITYRKAVD